MEVSYNAGNDYKYLTEEMKAKLAEEQKRTETITEDKKENCPTPEYITE